MGVDTADKTIRVTRGFQIDRCRPGLQQRAMVIGFMVVTVEQYQSPGVSSALSTTLLEEEVPLSTK